MNLERRRVVTGHEPTATRMLKGFSQQTFNS